MFIVHVAPIQKRGVGTLTYFSTSSLAVGSVVLVPVRKRAVRALVLECEDAKALKSVLRANLYEMKKLPQQECMVLFTPAYITALQTAARYFATSLGTLIELYTPQALFDIETIPSEAIAHQEHHAHSFERCALQLPRTERIATYNTLIRSNFAQQHSTYIVVPTTREARLFGEVHTRGIEQYTYVLESSQSPKKQKETIAKILAEPHPVVIVATPGFVSIPRTDIGMYILEHEPSSVYVAQRTPYTDARIIVEELARASGAKVVYAGTTLSTRIHKDIESGFVRELEHPTSKLRVDNSVTLVNTKVGRSAAKEDKKAFPTVSDEVCQALLEATNRHEHSFVFAPRRGLATYTVCNECHTPVVCASCKAPLTLHEHRGSRELLCHRCGVSSDAHARCTTCDSWNLVPLGIGIEGVVSYLKRQLPNAHIFVISSDTTKTPKQARAVADEFYATVGAILVGTEMALSYITEPINTSAVVSVESLLGVPDFRIEEKIFELLAILRENTTNTVLIETTNPENAMLLHAQAGNMNAYAKEELALRKQLGFPPYTHLIRISSIGTRAKVIADMEACIELLKDYSPRVFRGFIPKGRDVELRALVRIPTDEWPHDELLSKLRALPISCTIAIDPERIL